jgi:protocatechuate 3,4-dioxygenase beta subunit
MHHHHDDERHEHDRGLSYDLPTVLNRRRLLTLLGGAGAAAALVACTTDDGTGTGSATSGTGATTPSGGTTSGGTGGGAASGEQIPAETGGPYPADGSNGVNVLNRSGIVRSDITRSFGGASAVAAGVPLTIKLTVLDTKNGSAPLQGAAVYLWHCDREGRYSLYSQGVVNENYLRGVQAAGADGSLTFTSIFPGGYSGRWPHIHFEVYPSLEKAAAASDKLRTSQLAFPEDACRLVYASSGYEQSLRNLGCTSLATDNVFRDGWSLQLGTVTGDVAGGLTVALNVPV